MEGGYEGRLRVAFVGMSRIANVSLRSEASLLS